MRIRDHFSAFMLPFFVLGIVPFCLLFYSNDTSFGWSFPSFLNTLTLIFGLLLILFGLVLMIVTIRLFYRVGNGTLAPWAPTKHLVVEGIYQRTRNPMISGVGLVAFGEGIFFSSWPILIWTILIFLLNHFYFIYSEEPGLQKRFGEEYDQYKENVPRWIPRRTPWTPDYGSEE